MDNKKLLSRSELENKLENLAGVNISDDVYYELELMEECGAQWEHDVPWKGYEVYSPFFKDEAPTIGLPLVILVKKGEARMTTPDESLEYLKYKYETMVKKGMFDEYIKEPDLDKWQGFSELMQALDFQMDCYESFNKCFPEVLDKYHTLTETEREEFILEYLKQSDIQIVGNFIFSRYREITHWSQCPPSSPRITQFFPQAFALLEQLLLEVDHI